MPKILIIEDDSYIATELRNWLLKEKHSADVSLTGDDGLYRLQHFDYDMAIVDWNLPDIEGVEICKLIRKEKSFFPLLILTSRKDLSDRITGLDSGATDYLVKPCALPELSARIRALLRRQPEKVEDKFEYHDLALYSDSRLLFISGVELRVSPTEFDILLLLMRNTGKAVDLRAIAAAVDKQGDDAIRNKVKNYMSQLRKKLAQGASKVQIEHNGDGYVLVSN
jgi:two-component system response regulator MprA